jgi:hypothetical protein
MTALPDTPSGAALDALRERLSLALTAKQAVREYAARAGDDYSASKMRELIAVAKQWRERVCRELGVEGLSALLTERTALRAERDSQQRIAIAAMTEVAALSTRLAVAGEELAALSIDYGALLKQSDEYERERDALREDAERWRAFLASDRIRFFGTAGPHDDGYAHFGGEFWTRVLEQDAEDEITKRNRNFLIRYADAARRSPTTRGTNG